jgi:hypothetical protein
VRSRTAQTTKQRSETPRVTLNAGGIGQREGVATNAAQQNEDAPRRSLRGEAEAFCNGGCARCNHRKAAAAELDADHEAAANLYRKPTDAGGCERCGQRHERH